MSRVRSAVAILLVHCFLVGSLPAIVAQGGDAKPDLVVTDIAWTPAEPRLGDDFDVHVTLKNQGGADAAAFSVELDGIYGSSSKSVSALAAGAETTITYSYSTLYAREYTLNVTADKSYWEWVGGDIAESDESNNERSETVQVGESPLDLRIVSITSRSSSGSAEPYPEDDDVTFNVTVENVGTEPSGAFHVSLWRNEEADLAAATAPAIPSAGAREVADLAAGAKTTVEFTLVEVAPEDNRTYAFAGHAKAPDRDPTNNGAWSRFAVSPAPTLPPAEGRATTLETRLPEPRFDSTAVSTGSHVYILGGKNATGYANEILRFDPATGTAERTGAWIYRDGTGLTGRTGMSAVWTGEHILMFGGYGIYDCSSFAKRDPYYVNSYCDSILRYDPADNTVVQMKATLPPGDPTIGRAYTSAVWDGKHAYIFGGSVESTRDWPEEIHGSKDIIRYDPASDTATTLDAALPSARTFTTAFWDGQHAYVMGGSSFDHWSSREMDEIVRFDPATQSVELLRRELPKGFDWTPRAAYNGTTAFLFSDDADDVIMQYAPSNGIPRNMTIKLPTAMSGGAVVAVGEAAYVLGGKSGDRVLDTIVRVDSGGTVAPPALPDLRVKALAWTPTSPKGGDTVTVHATLENVGAADAGAFTARVLLDGTASGDQRVASLAQHGALALEWTLSNVAAGSRSLRVEIDGSGEIAESNDTNNNRTETFTVAEAPASLPDLVVSAIAWTPATPRHGDDVVVSVTVKNEGGQAAGAFEVFLEGVGWSSYHDVSGIAAGAEHTLTKSMSDVEPRDYLINVTADEDRWGSGSEVDESNETNNARTITMKVGESPVDLRIVSVTWQGVSAPVPAGAPAPEGEDLNFTVVIENAGTEASGAFSVTKWENEYADRAANGTLSIYYGSKSVRDLAPGARTTLHFIWEDILPEDNRTFIQISATDRPDRNTTDNGAWSRFTVAPTPAPTPPKEGLATLEAKLPTARARAVAVSTGSVIYILGGHNGTSYTNEILRFDPAAGTVAGTGAFLPAPSASDGRVDMSAVWNGTHVLMFGGYGTVECSQYAQLRSDYSSYDCDDILAYDPSANTVVRMGARLPSGGEVTLGRYVTSAVWDGKHAYVFGGYREASAVFPSNDIIRYDPATDTAVLLQAELPSGRWGTAAFWDGTHAYVSGGWQYSTWGHNYLNEIVRFDPASGEVVVVPPKLPSRVSAHAAGFNGTSAFLFGGEISYGDAIDKVIQYTPAEGALGTMAFTLPTPRASAAAAAVGDTVYVFGGTYRQDGASHHLDTILRIGAAATSTTPPPVGPPDLRVAALSWTPAEPRAGETVTVEATITNSGAGAAGAFTARLVLDGSDSADQRISGLASAASRTLAWTLTDLAAGTHQLRIETDGSGEVAESNETNNNRTASFTVAEAPVELPDLVVDSLAWAPASPVEGDEVTFNVTVRNSGAGAAGAFDVRLSWAGLVGETSVAGLAAGAKANVSFRATAGAAGTAEANATADPAGAVAESDEANNTRRASVTIAPPAPSPDPNPAPEVDWQVPFRVVIPAASRALAEQAALGSNASATFGYDRNLDHPEAPEPSFVAEYAQLFALHANYSESLQRLNRSYLPPSEAYQWTLRLATKGTTGNATLSWSADAVAGIPSRFSVLLTTPTGVVDLRAASTTEILVPSGGGVVDLALRVSTATTFSIGLVEGWNMVSIPVKPADASPAAVFGDAAEAVWTWNGQSYEQPTLIEPGRAYWVLAIRPATVNVTGTPLSQVQLTLHEGWNMVGGPLGTGTIQDRPAGVEPGMWHWNGATYEGSEAFASGKGYWLLVTEGTHTATVRA